ncbi:MULTISPECIES: nuclear transport factor 2 family protein [Streptomyces]
MTTMSSSPEQQRFAASECEISNLMSAYAYRNDDYDISGLGDLFADAVFTLDGTAARGRTEIEELARGIIEVRADGRSATTHELTNIMISVDEAAATAVGHAYWTLYRTVPGTPREAVLSGRYLDHFAYRDGRWGFAERRATTLWSSAT